MSAPPAAAAPAVGVARWVPGLPVLRGYRRAWLRTDAVAGITVAAYLVPQVMAYAGVAGVPPVVGLWSALLPLLVYAFLGSSRLLSVGPESTTALMGAVAVAPLVSADPARYPAMLAMLAILVGVIAVVAGFARLGVVADLLSRPVLVGYLAGVAVLMIVGQLERITGVPVSGDGFFAEVRSFFAGLDQIDWPTTLLAAVVLAFLLVTRARWPRVPGPLLAVLLATAAVVAFGWETAGIAVVGPVPQGLPPLGLPAVGPADVAALLGPAVAVAVVGFTDNMLEARAFAGVTGERIDGNAELRAMGLSNIGSGISHGFPISSSGSRTALAASTGARTQVYALVVLTALVCVLLFAGPLLASFPTAALGAIVVYAALRLVDVAELRALWAFRRTELALAVSTTVGVLVLNILYGILVAVGLSVLDLLARVARPHAAVLGVVPGLAGMHDLEAYPAAREEPGLVVFRYDSPLFFANAEDFRARALASLDARPQARWLLLNAEANVEIDSTGIAALRDLIGETRRRGVVLAMARVKSELQRDLERTGLLDLIGPDLVFPTLPTAVDGYRAWQAQGGPTAAE